MFFRGWSVRLQKEGDEDLKKPEEYLFKKVPQKQPENVFPRMTCPIPKGIHEKSKIKTKMKMKMKINKGLRFSLYRDC